MMSMAVAMLGRRTAPRCRGRRSEDGKAPAKRLAGILRSRDDQDRSAPDRAPKASGVVTKGVCDAIILGTRADGGPACRLTPSGKRVLLLERRDLFPRRPPRGPGAYPKNEARVTGCAHQARPVA